jgi:hypothetical protein
MEMIERHKLNHRGTRPSAEGLQVPPGSRSVVNHEVGRDTQLEARGLLPTKESPVLFRAAGKNGFGLFLYLEKGLDLQTLNRLAKCTELGEVIKTRFCSTMNVIPL